ncbi:MAG TPA: hypothetical protein VNZ45_00910, partial [Bacteroidia bacterium]|nr:hypothetical protein [Bacteroidia bacterium]
MKKIFLIFAIFLSIKNVCIGQANSSKDIRVYNQSELLYVLYLTNGRMVLTENLILSAKNTDSVELI